MTRLERNRAANRRHYLKHREQVIAKVKERYRLNTELCKETARNYYDKNRLKIKLRRCGVE